LFSLFPLRAHKQTFKTLKIALLIFSFARSRLRRKTQGAMLLSTLFEGADELHVAKKKTQAEHVPRRKERNIARALEERGTKTNTTTKKSPVLDNKKKI